MLRLFYSCCNNFPHWRICTWATMGFPFDSSYFQIALGSCSQRCFLSVIYILNMSYHIVYLHLFYTQQRTSDTSVGIFKYELPNFIIYRNSSITSFYYLCNESCTQITIWWYILSCISKHITTVKMRESFLSCFFNNLLEWF